MARKTPPPHRPAAGLVPPQHTAARRQLPTAIALLLGDPPLTEHEDRAAYNTLLHQLADSLGARDVVEWLWIRDMTDLAWDGRRLRQAKAAAIAREHRLAAMNGGVQPSEGDGASPAGGGAASPSERAFGGEACRLALKDVEKLERLIVLVDARRDAVLHDLEQRRRATARAEAA